MLSETYTNFDLGCADFHKEIQNADMKITPENAYIISFRRFRSGTTYLMEHFLEDRKTYMVFRFGSLLTDKIFSVYLVAKHEPFGISASSAPSISSLKAALAKSPMISKKEDGGLTCYISKQLHPLVQTIYSTLPTPLCEGLFTIANPVTFKAQLPDDRCGFYKEYIRGELRSQKNYGDCSMAFSIVGLILE